MSNPSPSLSLIDTAEAVKQLCAELESAKTVAIDTEFIRETTFFPVVALVQVATKEKTWLVDPLKLTPEAIAPLLDFLKRKDVLKVLHAAQADQECFYTDFGFTLSPSIDTAVCASLCGYGESVGLAKLMREEMGVRIEKGHARTDWTVRPLPRQLLEYAKGDVDCLVELSERLLAKLEKLGRKSWAFELSSKFEQAALYEPNPKALASKLAGKLFKGAGGQLAASDLKSYGVLLELLRWREERARKVDIPRRRVMDDDVIVDLARAKPKTRDHLEAFRGLNRGEIKASGDQIIAAIVKGLESSIPREDLPDRKLEPEGDEIYAVALLDCVLKLCAEKLELAPRHLITSEGLLKLLRGKHSDINSIVSVGIMSKGAADLAAQTLLDVLQGRASLALKNGHPELVRREN